MLLNVEIEQNCDYDIIVVGGGPSGCCAAAAAAREGVKVLLIEATSCLGGMATSGLVPAWTPFSDGERIIYKGFAEKIFTENKKSIAHIRAENTDWVPINCELLKRQFDELLEGLGVDILFNTFFSHLIMDGNGQISNIIVSNKKGLTSYKSTIYIDCTGDADLAAMAGATYEKGDNNGQMQPASHCFTLTQVDDYSYMHGNPLHPNNPNSTSHALMADKEFDLIDDLHLCDKLVARGTIGLNAGHIWDVDNTDPVSVSKGLIKGRRIAEQYRVALAKHHPAFANSYLVCSANLIGIRETRRIIGDYYLTIEDYINKKSFDDDIARNCYYIDVHSAKDEVEKQLTHNFNPTKRFERYKRGESHGIPFRCLIPKGINNLLVAGRSISTDRPVQGSTRVMPVCMVVGEAAGCGAAMALPNADVRKVDAFALREKLRGYGNYLP